MDWGILKRMETVIKLTLERRNIQTKISEIWMTLHNKVDDQERWTGLDGKAKGVGLSGDGDRKKLKDQLSKTFKTIFKSDWVYDWKM